jgi:predicted N-formylglutamate amidohydrolase
VSDAPFRIVGEPRFGGILIVSDHASNRVPDDIELGIPPALFGEHVALDIGVMEVAERMAGAAGVAAYLGNVSRLVCDFNREEDSPGLVPHTSDGHPVPGNLLDAAGREERLARFHWPFHLSLAELLDRAPPALIISLHSFTPSLKSMPQELRPWQVGVLYNEDARAARLAIPLLEAEGVFVGEQQPYSGKVLNATMNRHAEAEGRPYLGIEIRQDLLADAAGQAEWAERLSRIANRVALELE